MKNVPLSLEKSIYLSLRKLFFGMINDVRNGYTKDIPEMARKFLASDEVDRYLNNLMARMATRIRIDTARSWREAANKGSQGPLIYELMKHEMDGPVGQKVYEIISENAAYIKTVPQDWAVFVSKYAAREALKGKRPEEIEEDLRRIMPGHITKNLKCIARTECAKANAAICEARAEAVGIKCYFWRSVRDNRTRDSHWDMNGILCFYDDPPEPERLFPYGHLNKRTGKWVGVKPYGRYHAGNTFNCRCYQEPVVDVRFLPDVFQYHRHGEIYKTTKAAFIKQFGNVA